MTSKLWMSVAARALAAATAIGFSGVAWAQSGAEAENGVHAVPTGPVAQESLAPPARPGAEPVRRVAAGPRLTLQAVAAAPVRDEAPPFDAEPAPTAAPAATDAAEEPSEEAAVMGRRAAPAPAAQPAPVNAPVLAQAAAAAQQVQPAAAAAPAQAAEQQAPVDPAPATEAAPPAPVLADAAPAAAAPVRAAVDAPAVAAQAVQAAAEEDAEAVHQPEPPQLARAEPAPPAPEREARVQLARAEAPPPAPDEGIRQHVGFPRRSADAASAFVRYMDRASRIDAGLKSGQAVEDALQIGSAYDSKQLDEGMIAYGAIAALQSQAFVYGVMDIAAREGSRRDVIESLLSDPAAASRLPGASEAAALASEAIAREGRRVLVTGKALKQAAYDVQLQAWSKARPADQPARLASAKALSAHPGAAHDGDVAKLIQRISSVQPAGDGSPFTPVAVRSVALAALSVLDGAGEENAGRLQAVASDPASAQCLRLAKLNLFQCLSVAGPEYEDVYCLGQHAVLDTGQCVTAAAKPLSPLLQAALPRRQDPEVMIPTAGMSRAPQLQ